MTPEFISAESLALVLTDAIAPNTDVSRKIRDKYGNIGNWIEGTWVGYRSSATINL